LEEEVWNRLRTNNADAGQLSPGIHNHSPGNSPWSRAIITNGTAGISPLDSTLNTNPSPIPFNATALSTTAEFLEAPAHQVTSSASPTNIDHALIHAANLVNNGNEHDTSQPDDLSIAVPQVNTQNAMNSSTTNQRNQVNNKNSSKIMKSKAIAQPLNPLPLPSQSHNKPDSTRRLSNAEAQSTLSSTATPSTVGQTQNTPPTTSHK
uniref:BZIP domain-containing protein n=1 Tax=Anisakis simplex TaxID=6269 RepID=A0A0M3JJC6_ANISI